MFKITDETLDDTSAEPTFLRVRPDGFDDGSTLRPELIATPMEFEKVVKLFVNNELVHTSEECKSDPKCPKCNDPRARKYLRLRVEVDGREFRLDLPPSAAPRFVALARKGIEGALRITCTRREESGRAWGEIGFEIAKEAA